ncbi:MAG: hypothetical protein LBF74_03720 [Treponema sp.]|nr:hypothetical protein [Treponema sp.]
MRNRTIFFTFYLLFFTSSFYVNAQDLRLDADDIIVENQGDSGLHIFIRKKPDIGSVMLMESTKDPASMEDTLAYRALEWNPINGDEPRVDASGQGVRWSLLDSSPEPHLLLEEAFHIYIPPIIVYGSEEGRQGTVAIAEGAYINTRTFALPYADSAGGFEDNPFTLDYFLYTESPALQPESVSTPPDPPPPSGEPDPPIPAYTEAPGTPEEEPVMPGEEDGPPPLEEEAAPLLEREAPFAFAPHIEARFGLRVFFPGPQGASSLPLKNTYNPVGNITLTQQVDEALGFVLEAERESFSLNRLVARAVWDAGAIGIEAGLTMGILNTSTWDISPGLSLALRLRLPWWNFSGFFRLDSALGREPAALEDYTQSYAAAALSYAFPQVKFTLGMTERGSSVLDNQGILRTGRWIRCNLATEFPLASWGFQVEVGLEQLQWNYQQALVPLEYDGDITVYIGLEASYTFPSGFLTLIAGLEGPVYPLVYPTLIQNLNDPQAPFYGRATLGFRLTP